MCKEEEKTKTRWDKTIGKTKDSKESSTPMSATHKLFYSKLPTQLPMTIHSDKTIDY